MNSITMFACNECLFTCPMIEMTVESLADGARCPGCHHMNTVAFEKEINEQ